MWGYRLGVSLFYFEWFHNALERHCPREKVFISPEMWGYRLGLSLFYFEWFHNALERHSPRERKFLSAMRCGGIGYGLKFILNNSIMYWRDIPGEKESFCQSWGGGFLLATQKYEFCPEFYPLLVLMEAFSLRPFMKNLLKSPKIFINIPQIACQIY